MKKLYVKEIDSTNRYLKSHYDILDHMTWLSTDYQIKGKGTKDRLWFGNEDSLMCSLLLKENIKKDTVHLIPLLSAQVLHKVLSKYSDHILIKWPNDLLMQHKKLSGILVESVILSHEVLALVIGFGININQQVFQDELKDIATSLTLSTSKTYDKEVIYDALIDQFEKDYLAFKKDFKLTIDYCNKYHVLNGKKISYSDHHELKIAKVIKIQDDGTLLVIRDKQEIALSSNDVSIMNDKKK